MNYRWLLPAVIVLAGCTPEAGEAFAEALATIILISMVVMFVGACVALVITGFELTVVVLNFVRPSTFSMVTGYVLAGLHGLSLLSGVALGFAEASTDLAAFQASLPTMIMGLTLSLAMGGLLGGSAWYAQRTLAQRQAAATPVATT